MIHRIAVPFALLACSLLPITAHARPATCLLEIAGKTYIDGPCDFSLMASSDDGSFKIMRPDAKYFAVLFVEGRGIGVAHWNEEPGANHAHTPLGQLRRQEACWINDNVKLCAW